MYEEIELVRRRLTYYLGYGAFGYYLYYIIPRLDRYEEIGANLPRAQLIYDRLHPPCLAADLPSTLPRPQDPRLDVCDRGLPALPRPQDVCDRRLPTLPCPQDLVCDRGLLPRLTADLPSTLPRPQLPVYDRRLPPWLAAGLPSTLLRLQPRLVCDCRLLPRLAADLPSTLPRPQIPVHDSRLPRCLAADLPSTLLRPQRIICDRLLPSCLAADLPSTLPRPQRAGGPDLPMRHGPRHYSALVVPGMLGLVPRPAHLGRSNFSEPDSIAVISGGNLFFDIHNGANPRDPPMSHAEPSVATRDIGVLIERLDKVFHDEKEYTKFLGCRGVSAQQLLDLLQDLLDYDSTLIPINKRRFCKALIRLSEESQLFPRCLTISGLEHGRLVAGGSFGDVYKGLLDGLSVAVKMMRVFEDSDIDALLKQFGREALIWRQLSHPNLLPFVGLYYFQDRICLVSPWMDNGHIGAFLKKESQDTDHLLSIILDVALGLKDLHDKGIVHGDLKGANIFVAPSRRACIADFGLSSIITAISSVQLPNSSKRTRGGTVRYQAPELHQGKHNDLCSDIYAFGCVVFELMTGKPPFPELGDGAVIKAVLEGRRPSRPMLCSGTPSLDSLWNLLQNCWEELPEMRPTAGQIVERLMGPDIRATRTESDIDWAHLFTSRLRRYVLGGRALPSVLEVEGMIFSDV